MTEPTKTFDEIRCLENASRLVEETWRRSVDRTLRSIGSTTPAAEGFRALGRLLGRLNLQIKRHCKGHSQYFWFYHLRRMLPYELMYLRASKEIDSSHFTSPSSLGQEIISFKWLFRRCGLACLKFGDNSLQDMTQKPPVVAGTTGHTVPGSFTESDLLSVWAILGLMRRFEYVRVRRKRLGKGGQFIWLDRDLGAFDVELVGDRKRLVEVYDRRFTKDPNILKFFGSWSEPRVYDFLPASDFRGYERLGAPVRITFPREGALLLTLGPNVGEAGEIRTWPSSSGQYFEMRPLWLPAWIDVGSLLSRLELIRGLMRKALELEGRPSYDMEDLILGLAALTTYVREGCEATPALWAQPLLYGYSVLSGGEDLIESEVLRTFRWLRKSYVGERMVASDREALLSVMADLSWNRQDIDKIDLRKATPTKLVFPVRKDLWLVDWTVGVEALMDIVNPFGRLEGAVSRLRGKELEEIVGEKLVRQSSASDYHVWWLGRERGFLRSKNWGHRDLDVGVVCGEYLVAVEVKAFSQGRLDYVEGHPEELARRWEGVVRPALRRIDSLARLVADNPVGENYQVPQYVRWVLPVVCTTLPEWIPTAQTEFWIEEELPRICSLGELKGIFGELGRGLAPQNRIPVTR